MHATLRARSNSKSNSKPRDAQVLNASVPKLDARILVVSDALAERNGVGTYYRDLAQQIEGRVASIGLIAPSAGSRAEHEWFSIPMPGDATQRLVCPRPKLLQAMIDDHAPDVIVLPTLGAYAYFALRAARRKDIRVCVAHHTNFEALAELYWNPWIGGLCCSMLQSMTNWLVRRADTVAVMNVEALRDARARGATCVRQMGTPVATPFLWEPRSAVSLKPPRVIFVGRLAAEKGIEQILAAARKLPHFEFCIGGDGPLRHAVQQQANDLPNLEYLGWLDRSQVLKSMDAADILVLPSKLETFGTVAIEALARRRYVLVSRDCGVAGWPELAQGLFTIRDDEDLAKALTRVTALPAEQRDTIAARGWNAVEQFNHETIAGWLRALAEVTGKELTYEHSAQATAS